MASNQKQMQADKQKWVDDVLSSIDSIDKASSASLTDKVMVRITRPNISKSEWVDEVMNSTEGISRAVTEDMTDSVLSRLGSQREYSISSANDNSLIWKIAASVVFLLLLNGVSIYRYQSSIAKVEKTHEMQAAASELGMGQASSDAGTAIFGN